jgi:hypothetical protein
MRNAHGRVPIGEMPNLIGPAFSGAGRSRRSRSRQNVSMDRTRTVHGPNLRPRVLRPSVFLPRERSWSASRLLTHALISGVLRTLPRYMSGKPIVSETPLSPSLSMNQTSKLSLNPLLTAGLVRRSFVRRILVRAQLCSPGHQHLGRTWISCSLSGAVQVL